MSSRKNCELTARHRTVAHAWLLLVADPTSTLRPLSRNRDVTCISPLRRVASITDAAEATRCHRASRCTPLVRPRHPYCDVTFLSRCCRCSVVLMRVPPSPCKNTNFCQVRSTYRGSVLQSGLALPIVTSPSLVLVTQSLHVLVALLSTLASWLAPDDGASCAKGITHGR